MKKKKHKYKNNEYKEKTIQNTLNEITNIEIKIQNIKDRIKNTNMDPITYEEIENPVIVKCCNQIFDFESISMYLSTKQSNNIPCPICRTNITKESLLLIDNSEEGYEESKEIEEKIYNYEDNDKLENINFLLQNKIDKKRKILIFSEYNGTYSNLLTLNINIRQLKGNQYVINKIINEYKESENLNILFLNAKHFGAGLNLENTTDIILYHKMDSELEKQVIGRAQRFGRKSQLKIWKMLYENEK